MAKMVTGIVTLSDGEFFLSNEAKTINGLNRVAFQLPYALVVASPADHFLDQCTSVISLDGFGLSFSNLKGPI
jgi:hypothetical protein